MQKITPCLWFNFNAEEAVNFYLSIFKDSKIIATSHYLDGTHAPLGSVLVIDFELMGQRYMALNGGPQFPFTDAVSFAVRCDNQEEIDYYWDRLMAGGGHPEQCGWLRDKFGVPWQIYPGLMDEMIRDSNKAKATAAMQAMMEMIKIDMAAIQKAYDAA